MEILDSSSAAKLSLTKSLDINQFKSILSSLIEHAASSGCTGISESFNSEQVSFDNLGTVLEALKASGYRFTANITESEFELSVNW